MESLSARPLCEHAAFLSDECLHWQRRRLIVYRRLCNHQGPQTYRNVSKDVYLSHSTLLAFPQYHRAIRALTKPPMRPQPLPTGAITNLARGATARSLHQSGARDLACRHRTASFCNVHSVICYHVHVFSTKKIPFFSSDWWFQGRGYSCFGTSSTSSLAAWRRMPDGLTESSDSKEANNRSRTPADNSLPYCRDSKS